MSDDVVATWVERDRESRIRLRAHPIWFRLHWLKTGRIGTWHRAVHEVEMRGIDGPVGACTCGVTTSWPRGRDHVEVEFSRTQPDPLCRYTRDDMDHPMVLTANPYREEVSR